MGKKVLIKKIKQDLMQNLFFKKVNPKAIIPSRGSKDAAGLDLYACIEEKVIIESGETKKIGTGIAIALPKETVGLVFGRSGLGIKNGISPANAVGVIDCDYRGEIIVGLHNYSSEPYIIEINERIAQLVVTPIIMANPMEVMELPETERGTAGFGSTGRL